MKKAKCLLNLLFQMYVEDQILDYNLRLFIF